MGRRLNVVIVAEGATDDEGKKISPEDVQEVIEKTLKVGMIRWVEESSLSLFQYDTRVTKLGHVQRGGKASFLDRVLGTRMGAEALATVLDVS